MSLLPTLLVAVPVLVGAAWLALAVVSAAASGSVERNGFVGLRTPYTRSDPRIWRRVHRTAMRPLRWTALAVSGLGVASLATVGVPTVSRALLVTTAAALAAGVVGSSVYAILRSKRTDRDDPGS